jgi:hypothetical protein
MTARDANGKVKPAEIDPWCGPPTVDLWQAHLRGEVGLGIMPPLDDGRVLFGVIDVDDYDIGITEIVGAIERAKLPLIPTRSKSGGGHLHLFAREPVADAVMEQALRNLAARLRIKLEPETKNEIIVTANLWAPYFGGDQTACGCVKLGGAVMTVGEFLRAAERASLSPADLEKLAEPRRNRTVHPRPMASKTCRGAPTTPLNACEHIARTWRRWRTARAATNI